MLVLCHRKASTKREKTATRNGRVGGGVFWPLESFTETRRNYASFFRARSPLSLPPLPAQRSPLPLLGQLHSRQSTAGVMQSQQYAMHTNPSTRPVGVLNLSMPAPQHSTSVGVSAAAPAASNSSGDGGPRDELGGSIVAGDVSFGPWDAGAAGRQTEQVH